MRQEEPLYSTHDKSKNDHSNHTCHEGYCNNRYCYCCGEPFKTTTQKRIEYLQEGEAYAKRMEEIKIQLGVQTN